MNISPIDRKPLSFALTGTDASGNPVPLTNVAVTVLPFRGLPDDSTTWLPTTYSSGQVHLVVAGPYADSAGAVPIPVGGGELWAKDVEASTVQAVRVGFISIG